MKMLSIRVVDAVVVRDGLAMCGRRKDVHVKSKKFEMSVSMSYFSSFALKSPSKTSVLFSNERFSNNLINLLGSDY